MEYNNPLIPIAAIPQYQEIPLQRVEPDYKKVLWFNWAIAYLFIIGLTVLIFIANDNLHKVWIISLATLVLSISIALVIASIEIGFKNRSWALREKDIIYKNGWLFQSTHIVPFAKVQHCILKTGPLGRRYNLASLRFMTAASHQRDISINGLSLEDAEKIKEHARQAI
jgi:membrane protein YdbS with pleckstrin-like domain